MIGMLESMIVAARMDSVISEAFIMRSIFT